MKTLSDVLFEVLRNPQPARLIALQEALLVAQAAAPAAEQPAFEQPLQLAGEFYVYLCELQSALTARQFSELASALDIGAVGAVACEHFLGGEGGGWLDFAAAALSEILMVIASRQYIKAWEAEMRPIHEQATWRLRQAFWRLSVAQQPDQSPAARVAAIQRLLAPALDSALPAASRQVLVGRLFQVLLLVEVGRLLPPTREAT